MNRVQICNLAIYPLGGNAITALTENSKEANLCNDLYLSMVKIVLGAHKWNFAKKEVTLAEATDYEMLDDRFEYAYQLPSDYIRLSRPEERDVVFERRGRVLATNETPFSIEYIASITDESLFSDLFAQAVAARLSVPLAQPLARKGSPGSKDLYIFYLTMLQDAMMEDAQDEKPDQADSVKHTNETDSWLKARTT